MSGLVRRIISLSESVISPSLSCKSWSRNSNSTSSGFAQDYGLSGEQFLSPLVGIALSM